MLAMVRYPEIAKRAQAEIDSVVGRDHSVLMMNPPVFDDENFRSRSATRRKRMGPTPANSRIFDSITLERCLADAG